MQKTTELKGFRKKFIFKPGDCEKIAKKAQFSHLDEARDQMVGKTYSEPATTSSLFFSLSNET